MRPYLSAHQRGFTLIEMLVSITVMILLVGGGIASYITFNDRQTLATSGRKLETLLRAAQKKARVGDKPAACNTLNSYEVAVAAQSNVITLSAICANGPHEPRTETLNPQITATQTRQIRFQVLHGGVTNAGTISLTNGVDTYEIAVSQGGEITDKGVTANQSVDD
jgi:prepilin-type N-terminal cleavage/methylation domain-containing protein